MRRRGTGKLGRANEPGPGTRDGFGLGTDPGAKRCLLPQFGPDSVVTDSTISTSSSPAIAAAAGKRILHPQHWIPKQHQTKLYATLGNSYVERVGDACRSKGDSIAFDGDHCSLPHTVDRISDHSGNRALMMTVSPITLRMLEHLRIGEKTKDLLRSHVDVIK